MGISHDFSKSSILELLDGNFRSVEDTVSSTVSIRLDVVWALPAQHTDAPSSGRARRDSNRRCVFAVDVPAKTDESTLPTTEAASNCPVQHTDEKVVNLSKERQQSAGS